MLPARLNGTLRPYQAQALAWLQFLRELGAGGVLADDMGLGKTLVTIALLAEWRDREGRAPSLVVCPTSVAHNWKSEIARFAPDLQGDVVITTYGLLRRNIDVLAKTRFRCAVLDEAQNVKNADAETTRAALRLDAEMRLALTGTPVENRLAELRSIMSFVNPGMLRGVPEVEDRALHASLLRALVRPFVLRRTKAQVLVDLPEKTEIDRVCIMGRKQRRLYDALALALRQSVKKDIEKRGLARSRLSVLTAILRLRQMACDPRLVDPALPASDGAKREAFLDLVRELASEGRRALVFSQFVELFTLWRADLDRERIAYEYLDGASTHREAIVARFQEGSAPLFLISLKAGGAGLNLTAADTVIHCDPWWNPAVEDQATDRAHRPGQSRKVTVVRLVAKDTIEEKILLLKEKKRELAAAVLGDAAESASALRGLADSDVRLLLGEDVSAIEEVVDDAPLTTREVDELRTIVRWLDGAGFPKHDLAKKIGIAASRLSLLLVGHRVRIARETANRIRALYESRARARPLTE